MMGFLLSDYVYGSKYVTTSECWIQTFKRGESPECNSYTVDILSFQFLRSVHQNLNQKAQC